VRSGKPHSQVRTTYTYVHINLTPVSLTPKCVSDFIPLTECSCSITMAFYHCYLPVSSARRHFCLHPFSPALNPLVPQSLQTSTTVPAAKMAFLMIMLLVFATYPRCLNFAYSRYYNAIALSLLFSRYISSDSGSDTTLLLVVREVGLDARAPLPTLQAVAERVVGTVERSRAGNRLEYGKM
jgi:hypothetical protein